MDSYYAFTTKASGTAMELRNNVDLESSFVVPGSNYTPQKWRGLWDTGASLSCIHKRVMNYMHLLPLGTKDISTANGTTPVDTCMINVILPNGVRIKDLIVACADIGNDVDILLGMDIINCGSFAVSNFEKQTWHSFIIPSNKAIDYNKDARMLNKISQSHRKKK